MCVHRMSGSCVYNRKTYLKEVQKQQMVGYNIEYPYNEIILKSVTQAYLLIYGTKPNFYDLVKIASYKKYAMCFYLCKISCMLYYLK